MNAPTILLACHEPGMRLLIKRLLETEACKVEVAHTEDAVIQTVNRTTPDLVLLDMLFGETDGLRVLERCKTVRPEQVVVMMSRGSEASEIVRAMRLGAQDFIVSPWEPSRLHAALARVFGQASEIEAPSLPSKSGDEVIDELDQDLFFLAASPVMKQIRAQAALVARVDMPVLLLGESGVGKEIIARLIHKLSPRSQGTFLRINCAALPSELLESELFGYEAGAFTGANRFKPGKFELSNKGTLLLDEIGEMSPWVQAKILHVLQDGHYSRLGGSKDVSTDVRILAATNIDVEAAIAGKKFRQDLFYRLNAFTVNVPPLRERREEIPFLLAHFMNNQATKLRKPALPISDRLVQASMSYHWPGNLRELLNIVKRYLVLEDENLIIEELKFGVSQSAPNRETTTAAASLPDAAGPRAVLDVGEFKEIQRALENSEWDQELAATELNISPKKLASKMKRYGLYPPRRQNRWLRYG